MKPVSPVSMGFLSLLTAFFVAGAARASVEIPGKAIAPLACDSGTEANSFSLSAPRPFPGVEGLKLPPFDQPDRRKIKAPDVNTNLRLDVCLGESAGEPVFTLKRVVLLGLFSGVSVVSIPGDAVVEGLTQAAFEQDYSRLKIDVPFHEQRIGAHTYPVAKTLIVRGFQNGEKGFAVAAIEGFPLVGSPQPELQSDALVGQLVSGDPIAGKRCGPMYKQEERILTLGTAKLALTVCTGGVGTSGTFAYSLVGIGVTDSSMHLPADKRNKTFTVEDPKQLAAHLRYSVQHHNTCDSFALTLPHATYSATAFTGTPPDSDRCDHPRVVAEAPVGTMKEHKGGIGYRFRYADGPVEEGDKTGCRRLVSCR